VLNLTPTTAGTLNNTTGTISANESGPGNPSNTATVQVSGTPTITVAFGAASIPLHGSTTLTFTINNPNATSLTGVGFNDTLPAGLVVSSPSGLTTTCQGTPVAAGNSISLTGATIAPGQCTISLSVTGTSIGTFSTTTSALASDAGIAGTSNTATVQVGSKPTITVAFGAASIPLHGSTTLTFTINNPNAANLTGVGFNDTLPAGLVVSSPSGLTTTCQGTPTAAGNSISLTGATVAPGQCTISLSVTGTSVGTFSTTTSALASDAGTAGTSNTATITVQALGTSTSLVSSLNPSSFGQSVTFKATVTGNSPTGTVTFLDGSTQIGSASLVSGIASFTTSSLTVGTHSITAKYSGDANNVASTSSPLAQVVSTPADSIKLREMQISTTPMIAQISGQAISGAIESAIGTGFAGGPAQPFTPNGNGFTYYFGFDQPAPAAASQQDSLKNFLVSPDGTNARVNNGFSALGYAPMPVKAPPPPVGPAHDWLAWIDVRGAELDSNGNGNDLKGWQVNTTFGVTRIVTPNFLVGALGGYEHFDYSSQAFNGVLKGDGWTTGAYLGWLLAPRLRFDAGAAWSDIMADDTSGAATGSFTGSRWLATTGLTGAYQIDRVFLEPSARVYALWEHENGYTDSLGTFQADRNFSNGRASVGAKVSYPFAWTGTIALTPYAGLYGDYYFSRDDALAAGLTTVPLLQGFSARGTGGVTATFDGGVQVSAGGELGGIGSDTRIWTWRLRGSVPF
jgi:hypothetical protein